MDRRVGITIWYVRTMPKTTTDETPFGLVYDTEVIARMKIIATSHRVEHLEPTFNNEQRRVKLNLVEKKRRVSDKLQGNMHVATARYYNRRVSSRQFYVGDMVWIRNEFDHLDRMNKLYPKW